MPAPAGHIALCRNSCHLLLLLGFLPAAPRNNEVDPRRRRGSEPLRVRSATGELRGAHHRPTGSGHTDPRVPVAAASCPSGRPPSLPAGAQRSSRWEPEVSVAAATRAAPLSAGKRPRLSPSPRPSPRPRPPRKEGAAQEAGPSGREEQSKLCQRKASGVYLELPPAGRRNNPRLKGRRELRPRASQASLRTIPSTRGCLLCRGQKKKKKLARDSYHSFTSRKGQNSENFREGVRVGVCASLP